MPFYHGFVLCSHVQCFFQDRVHVVGEAGVGTMLSLVGVEPVVFLQRFTGRLFSCYCKPGELIINRLRQNIMIKCFSFLRDSTKPLLWSMMELFSLEKSRSAF